MFISNSDLILQRKLQSFEKTIQFCKDNPDTEIKEDIVIQECDVIVEKSSTVYSGFHKEPFEKIKGLFTDIIKKYSDEEKNRKTSNLNSSETIKSKNLKVYKKVIEKINKIKFKEKLQLQNLQDLIESIEKRKMVPVNTGFIIKVVLENVYDNNQVPVEDRVECEGLIRKILRLIKQYPNSSLDLCLVDKVDKVLNPILTDSKLLSMKVIELDIEFEAKIE